MFNWFRPRRPARPTPRVPLRVELALEDRTVPCMGSDCVMTAAAPPPTAVAQPAFVAPPTAVAPAVTAPTQPAAVAPLAAAPPATASFVGPSVALPGDPDTAVPASPAVQPVAVAPSRDAAPGASASGSPAVSAGEAAVTPPDFQPPAAGRPDRGDV